jgi:hypothetical protein
MSDIEQNKQPPVDDDLLETSRSFVEKPVVEKAEVVEKKARPKTAIFENSPILPKDTKTFSDVVVFPSGDNEDVNDALEGLPSLNELMESQESRNWASTIQTGSRNTPAFDVYRERIDEEGSFWTDITLDNGQVVKPHYPNYKRLTGNVKGATAVFRVLKHLGLGGVHQTPLYHSGFWVSFNPPSEASLLELNRIMLTDKIKLGRSTYGLVFSNLSVYQQERLLDFCLAHVYTCSVKSEGSTLNLKTLIKLPDLPILFWGLVCSIYSRGFVYEQACIASPSTCKQVNVEKIDPSLLFKADVSNLTPWQKLHMSFSDSKSRDISEVKKYQEEFTRGLDENITIDVPEGPIQFTLTMPSAVEFIKAGKDWVSGIVEEVEKQLGIDADPNEKEQHIFKYAQASSLRQYEHMVKSFKFDDKIIDDKETLADLLSKLSSDDNIRQTLIERISKYIAHNTIALIGIPDFKCPSCQKNQVDDHGYDKHTSLIPLDVIQVFLDLLTQRLERLTDR